MAAPEYKWLNQYDQSALGLVIHVRGVPTDADGAVTVKMINEETDVQVFSRPATQVAVGTYEITLGSDEASGQGFYKLRWEYQIDGSDEFYETFIEVGEFSPEYAALTDGMKAIVEQTWNRFSDLFDSAFGGPHVQSYIQTHFHRGRMAQLLQLAVGRINTVAQPHSTYTLDGEGGRPFPFEQWGPLLEKALYVEALKHLRRSYVEQPMLMGGEVTRHDRRDYMDRWGAILQEEQQDLKSQLDVFKIRSMMLGRPAVLVSGGVFGRYGPTRYAGSAAARPRYMWQRFY